MTSVDIAIVCMFYTVFMFVIFLQFKIANLLVFLLIKVQKFKLLHIFKNIFCIYIKKINFMITRDELYKNIITECERLM